MFWTRKFGNSLLNNDSGEGADQTNTHDSKDTGGMKIDKGLTKSPFNSNDIVQNINATDNTISGTVQNKAGGSSGTHSGNQAEQIIGQSQ